jgi:hypothetical protein
MNAKQRKTSVIFLFILLPLLIVTGYAVAKSNRATAERLQTPSNPFTTDSLRSRRRFMAYLGNSNGHVTVRKPPPRMVSRVGQQPIVRRKEEMRPQSVASELSSAAPMHVTDRIVSLIDIVGYRNWPRRLILIYRLRGRIPGIESATRADNQCGLESAMANAVQFVSSRTNRLPPWRYQ